jgi:serine/threonine protein kinase
MELANTDWEKEIKKRGKVKNFYTEGELLTIAKRLIRTFSELQKYGISHRDIKPQNVLVIDNDYKICDFGEAKIIKNNQSEIHTLRGTELYMSPLLFKALKEKKNEVFHNVFKSDVFSLGMCMTLAASLNFKTLCEIREVNEMDKIKNILVKYLISKYSFEFIKILLMMLENDENKRPDFIQLEEKIRD